MVTWNGTNLAEKGIIVEHVPTIVKGKKNIETFVVDGRNGFIAIDNNTYDPYVLSLDCHFNTDTADIDEIKSFLDGYGLLSLDGERQCYAIVQNQIDLKKVAQANFRKFIIQFYCSPIMEDINETTANVTSNPFTLNILSATAEMFPILAIKGSGNVSITFNNKTFYLNDLDSTKTYTLDCNLKVIVDNAGNNCSGQMLYEFPKLKAGSNSISYTGTISTFTVKYRKAYI